MPDPRVAIIVETERKGAEVLQKVNQELGEAKTSAATAAAALNSLGIKAKEAASGGLERIVVAARDVDAATAIVRRLGSAAEVVSTEMKTAATRVVGAVVQERQAIVEAAAAETEAAQAAAQEWTDAMQRKAMAMARSEESAYRMAESIERAAQREGMAMARMHEQALRMNEAFDAQGETAEKLNPKFRSGANAIAMLAVASTQGTGSINGMAVAAGGLAEAIAAVSTSAAVAAAASGIGALVTVLALVVTVGRQAFDEMNGLSDEVEHFNAALNHIPNITRIEDARAAYNRLGTEMGAVARQIESMPSNGDLLLEATKNPAAMGAAIALYQERGRLEERLNLIIREREALQARINALQHDSNEAAKREAEQEAERIKRERERDAKRAGDLSQQMQDEATDAALRRLGQLEQLKEAEAERDYHRRVKEIQSLQVSEEEKTQLLVEAERARQERIAEARAEEAKRKKDEDDRQQKEEARKTQDAAKEWVKAIQDRTKKGIEAHRSGLQIMTQLALEPIVHWLEGAAVEEQIKAMKAAASGNWPGAALHEAAAVAAAAAAAKVASIGGGSSSSAGAGGSASGASTFIPTGDGGRGDVVVNVITQDPYGRDKIQTLRYALNRADTFDVPIDIPVAPTSGVAVTG